MTAAVAVEPIDLSRLSLDSFAGRPVAVLGLARSGIALCRFLADRGAVVTGYDARTAAELGGALDRLEGRPIRLLLGADVDPRAALADQALICTSPSVSSRYPTTEPRLRSALADLEAAAVVPVVSEVDLFLRLCPATTIGVTGTKGKTTTSALIHAILAADPLHPAMLGGNIQRCCGVTRCSASARNSGRPAFANAHATSSLQNQLSASFQTRCRPSPTTAV